MAVTSFDRIHQGRASRTTLQGGKVVTRYTDIWRAETNTNFTEPETVKAHANCPRIGRQHNRDPRAYCRSLSAVNEPFSKQVFLVTAGFSTEYEMAEDPLAEPARTSWHTEQYQVPVWWGRTGNVAHTNTAFDPFDPPVMKIINRWVAVTRRNVAAVPSWYLTYPDAVNNAPWNLDGVTIAKGFAKLAATDLTEAGQERNNVSFRVLTMTFQFADLDDTTNMVKWDTGTSAYVALGGSEFEHAHAVISPNVGMMQYIAAVKQPCLDSRSQEVMVPQLLDILGQQQDVATVKPSDALFVVTDVCPEKDFSVLPVA